VHKHWWTPEIDGLKNNALMLLIYPNTTGGMQW